MVVTVPSALRVTVVVVVLLLPPPPPPPAAEVDPDALDEGVELVVVELVALVELAADVADGDVLEGVDAKDGVAAELIAPMLLTVVPRRPLAYVDLKILPQA